MQVSSVCSLIVLSLWTISNAQTISRFEFENVVGGLGSRRSPWRTSASGNASLHMYEGDKIQLDLCSPEAMTVTLEQFLYSNDGAPDTISIRLDDGPSIVTLMTEETFMGWGKYWNTFKSNKLTAPDSKLGIKKHALILEVLSADCYGTEFDALEIKTDVAVNNETFFCGSKLIRSRTPSPCANDIDETEKPVATTRPASMQPTVTQSTEPQRTTPTAAMVETTTVSTSTTSVSSQRSTVRPPKTTKDATNMTTIGAPTTSTMAPTTSTMAPTTSTMAPTTTTMAPTTKTMAPTTTTMAPTTKTMAPTTKTMAPTTTTMAPTTKTMAPTTTTMASTQTIEKKTTTPAPPPKMTSPPKPATTTPKKPQYLVKQLSVPNDCLTSKNIRLRFTPLSLKSVMVIVREAPMRNADFTKRLTLEDKADACKSKIWQIGKFNNDNTELGPISTGNVDYNVNAEKESPKSFPGLINTQNTRTVTLRYVLPNDKPLGNGTAYLAIGMIGVSSDVSIGMQYKGAGQQSPSDIMYGTVTPEKTAVGWDIPAMAISSSLENSIVLYFNTSTTSPLKVDFIRLESMDEKPSVAEKIVATAENWLTKAYVYNPTTSGPRQSGMSISVDGGPKVDNLERIVLYQKPSKRSLIIYKDGKIFPFHYIKSATDPMEGSTLSDTSGIFFGNENTAISSVTFKTEPLFVYVNLIYEDGASVRFSTNYTDFRTKLKVMESTISTPVIEFFSTYITDYVTAVNEVVINNRKRFDIRDTRINPTKDRRYTFLRTTPNEMYVVSPEYEFVFPKKIIPK